MTPPSRKNTHILFLLVFTAGALSSAGCKPLSYIAYAIFGGGQSKVKAEYTGLQNEKTALIVASGPGIDFEYPYAKTNVALATAQLISKNVKGVEFIDQNIVEKFQMEYLDWPRYPVDQIGNYLKVTRILYLDLHQFTMHEENSVHLLRGQIQAAVRVYETTGPGRAAYNTEVGFIWPEHSPVPMSDSALIQLQKETIVKFAETLAKKFYDHKVPIK